MKKILLGITVLVVLVFMAAGLFLATLDLNDYKQDITAAVKDQTGRDLVFSGDLALTWFPRLGVKLGGLSLSNAQGFGDGPFASAEDVSVSVAVFPLLKQQVEVSTVVVKGLQLDLQRKKDGSSNWDDLAGTPTEPVAEVERAEDVLDDDTATSAAPLAIAVGGVQITNAKVSWRDAMNDQSIRIDPLSLTTGALRLGESFPLNLDITIKGEQPRVDVQMALATQLAFDLDAQRYQLSDLKMDVAGSGEMIPVDSIKLAMSAKVDADLVKQDVVLSAFALQLDAKGESLPAGQATVKLSAAEATANLSTQLAELTGLDFSAYNVRMTGALKASEIMTEPRAQGELQLTEFSPRALLTSMQLDVPVTADDTVLNKVSGTFGFNGDSNNLIVNSFKLNLDDTQLEGHARVDNFAAPAMRFDINVDDIDVDRYLPPPAPTTETTAESPASSPSGADDLPIGLPVELLRDLNMNGKFTIGKIKASDLRFSKMLMTLKSNKGVLRVSPFSFDLYGGSSVATAKIDVSGKTPSITFVENLKDVQSGPLMKDLMGDDKVKGKANAVINIQTAGLSINDFKKNLNGTVKAAFENGEVKGFNLRHMIKEAQARLQNKPLPKKETLVTDFSAVSVSANIKNGLLNSKDLKFASPYLRLEGQGWVSLPKETMDYTAYVTLVDSKVGQGATDQDDLSGVTIPVQVTGTFDAPKPNVKIGTALKNAAKKAVKRDVEKKKEKIKDDLNDKLKDKLKGLFK